MIIYFNRIFGVMLVLGALTPAHAEIYKWKDAHGETHYSNTLPPQAAGYANTELNKNGLVIKQKQAALTPQQRLIEEAEQTRMMNEQQTLTEQKRHDTALLNTYTSPAEIDLARERNLEQTRLIITGTNSRITPLRDKQAALIKQAGGKIPASGSLAVEYQDNARQISQLNDLIAKKNKEMSAIHEKFAADKARFAELTTKPAVPTNGSPGNPSPGTPGMSPGMSPGQPQSHQYGKP